MSWEVSNLLWLLLPLAAASGWLAARLDQRHRSNTNTRVLPATYFKGLNFLLNEQPDKAIEVFIRELEVDDQTVETHLALGNLFRRRGEVERAIRIHQNLIARPTLNKQQRSQALLELGQDYFKAGLFDRAENLFLELAENRSHTEQALRFLVHIYQQERDWENAIVMSRRLARAAGKNQGAIIAQYYCEQAETAVGEERYAEARRLLTAAQTSDRACVRASILLGRVEAKEGKHREAIRAWRKIEEQAPNFLGEVAGPLAESFRSLGDESGLYDYFQAALQRHGNLAMMLIVADIIKNRHGVPAAEEFVADWLRNHPSVHGLQRLLALNMTSADAESRADLALLQGIIEELLHQHEGYVCEHCGFRGKSLHWLCPGCGHWNTIKPLVNHNEDAPQGGAIVHIP